MINRIALYQSHLLTTKDHFKSLVGVVQLCASNDAQKNFEKNKHYIEMCAQRGAKLICLPENFNFIGKSYDETLKVAEPLYGQTIKKYKQLALDN